MRRWLQRLAAARRSQLVAYGIPVLTIGLLVLAGFSLARTFLTPGDAIIIEVVPLEDDALVQVQIAGAVARPGVYSLDADSTLADLLDAAGGVTEGAGTESLDLAGRLSDGAFIYVPTSDAADAEALGPLDINTATASELETLPGIGPVIAERIVQYREGNGGFGSVEQLAEVTGISERMVEELRPFIDVGAR